ncbi:hypothetical protein [Yinghuangia soli]|uniref:Uncharacterized protein n=1 Tax=Yinghuangia soli TaxID=2908204 RepID=A0AA41U6U1_9ACTN|nr:hypothetical protein [Yinghuangia soli]MCF2531314.1 hypothetical protein [Yinghuangia soli]
MKWLVLVPAAIAVAALLSGFLNHQYRQPRGRHKVKMDLEILGLLPKDSGIRTKLLGHIDATIKGIIEVEDSRRRDWQGIWLAVVFLVTSGSLFYGASENDGDWWWLASGAIVAFVGTMGLLVSGPKRQRDIGGSPIDQVDGDQGRDHVKR